MTAAGPLLALDTCLAACSAALLREDGAVFARSEVIGTGHAERIAPMVEALLAEAGVEAGALTRIAATVGPGSFMGTRVGISLAKGLALPRRLPTVPVSTLRGFALSAAGPACVLIDARREQAYVQRFGADGAPLGGPELLPHAEAVKRVRSGDRMVGTGLRAILAQEGAGDEMTAPDPERIARWAEAAPPAPLRPLYLRPPDAKAPSRAPL